MISAPFGANATCRKTSIAIGRSPQNARTIASSNRNPSRIDSLKAFRASYPKGRNFVISPQVAVGYARKVNGMPIDFIPAAK